MTDHMELGESGLIPIQNGWFLQVETGMLIDPDGNYHNPATENSDDKKD